MSDRVELVILRSLVLVYAVVAVSFYRRDEKETVIVLPSPPSPIVENDYRPCDKCRGTGRAVELEIVPVK